MNERGRTLALFTLLLLLTAAFAAARLRRGTPRPLDSGRPDDASPFIGHTPHEDDQVKKSKSQLSFEDQAPAMSVAVAEAPVEMTWVDLITPTCQALFLGVIAGFTARVGMTMHLDAWTVSGIVAALTTGGIFVAMASRVR